MTDHGALSIPLAALERELAQIRSWIQSRPDHPFGDARFVQDLSGQLKSLVNKVGFEVRKIKDDIADDRMRSAWRRYARLQREALPQLANELLAVIGGQYLSSRNLDDMHFWPPGVERPDSVRTMSFSSVARDLLDDLSNRTNARAASLLIVGEERQVAIGTDIVRLRFPACDVWNLPFTAHEYGYLVAHSQAAPRFKNLREEVERGVDPRTHDEVGGQVVRPDHPYLADVVRFWESGASRLPGDVDDEPLVLRELRTRQTAHLCRLFGDAFATYFVGPAYVQALLHLRFRPDEQLTVPGGMVPAFVERFVVALETLRRMDEDRDLYSGIDIRRTSPFAEVLDKSGQGLPSIWAQFLASAGIPADPYAGVASRLKPWVDRIWRAIVDVPEWRDENQRADVFECWREALEVFPLLKNPQWPMHWRPRPWAVVNGAWMARLDEGDEGVVEAAALRLLDRSDTDAVSRAVSHRPGTEVRGASAASRFRGVGASAGRTAEPFVPPPVTRSVDTGVAQPRALTRHDLDMREVQSGLFSHPDKEMRKKLLASLFSETSDPEVEAALYDNPAAMAAYRRLLAGNGDEGAAGE